MQMMRHNPGGSHIFHVKRLQYFDRNTVRLSTPLRSVKSFSRTFPGHLLQLKVVTPYTDTPPSFGQWSFCTVVFCKCTQISFVCIPGQTFTPLSLCFIMTGKLAPGFPGFCKTAGRRVHLYANHDDMPGTGKNPAPVSHDKPDGVES